MGHYIRILSPSEKIPSIARIKIALAKEKLAATLTVESDDEQKWTQLSLAHKDGNEIANIERDALTSSALVSEEIEAFLEEISDCKPASAAAWLAEYLPVVKTIYAFQVLSGTGEENGWDILGTAKDSIFNQVGGIIQADGEGFTDEEGFHILWQFSNSVKGLWWMSVHKDGEWLRFQMDLGNKKHRAAFLRGHAPDGVEITDDF